MSYNCFQLEIADNIAHVQLSRPQELNSMTLDFWRELPEIIEKIDQDASARVIVISSTGRHFTAGMDLSVFQSDSQLSGEPPPPIAVQRRMTWSEAFSRRSAVSKTAVSLSWQLFRAAVSVVEWIL